MSLFCSVYAPMGLSIKERWTIGGNAPGEPVQPAEIGIGAPVSGLYLREDVEIKCNFMITKFVRKQLKDALATLVARLLVKSQLLEAVEANKRLTMGASGSAFGGGLGSQLGRSQYGSQHGGRSNYGGSQHGSSDYGDSEPPNSPRLPMSPPLSAGLNMAFPKPQGGPPQRLSEQFSEDNQQHQPPQNTQLYQQHAHYQQQNQQYQPQNQQYQPQNQQYQQPYQQSPPQKFQQPTGPHPSKFISEMEGSQRYPQGNEPAPVELA